MFKAPFKILLVEDNPGDARLIQEMLADARVQNLTVEWVSRLTDGLEGLSRDKFDLVLLDLGLPDSSGMDTFIKTHAQAPQVPIVVLSGLADETLALTAVRQGAQDYLFKDETDSNQLLRAIRYATERKQAELALGAERKKLYAVLNSLPAYVYLKKADFSIHFANRRFTETFGESENRRCYEVLRGRSEPCEHCKTLEVFKTKTPQQGEWTSPLNGRTYEVHNYPFCVDNDLLVLTLGLDITARKQADEKLRESEQNLRYLASQLLTAQERERERISRELHDELGQSLLVMKLQAGYIEKQLPQEQAVLKQECRKLTGQFDQLVDEVRRLARDLSPTMVRDLGLALALNRLIRDFSGLYGVQAEVEQTDVIDQLLSREAQINIYRIFQESLTNIGKYAQASSLQVVIKAENGQVSFLIADNGKGFKVEEVWGRDPASRGLGLMAMEERARMMGGVLEIKSQEGQGTQLTFQIPVSSSQTG
jgi:two-component system, NarL family, sensor histidine kinase UhpB